MDSSRSSDQLEFYVNGGHVRLSTVDPEWSLLHWLRRQRGLTGTKRGCSVGGCGACTVMLSEMNAAGEVRHRAVNACLLPLCCVHGRAVTTVEGVGSIATRLHPVQQRLAESHGSQCGFCSPGMVMSMYTLLRNCPQPSLAQIRRALQGNLCRCTGYRPILDAFSTFSGEPTRPGGCGLRNCCQLQDFKADGDMACRQERVATSLLPDEEHHQPFDPSQEPIFPPQLAMDNSELKKSVVFFGPRVTWYRPVSMRELLELREQHPEAKLQAGNTALGLETRSGKQVYPIVISITEIAKLRDIEWHDGGLTVGAGVTIAELDSAMQYGAERYEKNKTKIFVSLSEILPRYGSEQVRNVATVGGNIIAGNSNSDLITILMAVDCQLKFAEMSSDVSTISIRCFHSNVGFVFKQTLLSITIPFSDEHEFFTAFKQTNRREFELAMANAGFFLCMNNGLVKKLRINIGALGDKTITAFETERTLVGMKWNDVLLNAGYSTLLKALQNEHTGTGYISEYHRTLIVSLFFKFFLKASEWMGMALSVEQSSALKMFESPSPCSSQLYQLVPEDQHVNDLIGRPITHVAATKQVTGEATYTDDIPSRNNELFAALVLSTVAHAKLISVNPAEALDEPGVTHFFCANDLTPEQNTVGIMEQDEEIFRRSEVTSMGQVIGVVLGKDELAARRAAQKVQVDYDPLPVVVTIEEAIESNLFSTPEEVLEFGDVDSVLQQSEHRVSGQFHIAGQEHFYMETMTCLAEPVDKEELVVHTTTQFPTGDQERIAHVLGIAANRIVCKVKRLGGAFGGKESRSATYSSIAALAAHKTSLPVRLTLDREEDMVSTGNRQPFSARYTVGVTTDGTLTGVKVAMFANGGYSADLSMPVVMNAVRYSCGAYRVPAYRVTARACKTNIPSNTAFRGFGAPQGYAVAETMMDHVARYLGLDQLKLRTINLLKNGDFTLNRKQFDDITVDRCVHECIQTSNYHQRVKDTEHFNKTNKWRKRGICLTPIVYLIGYCVRMLEQGTCLVNIYKDGSVLITIGGVEMGQGLFTKCCQIATRVLGVPLERVYISETATDKVPNAVHTAGSRSTDLFGEAVKNACEILWRRLTPFREARPDGNLCLWVTMAYRDAVCLSAVGHHVSQGVTWKGSDVFNYFVSGAACSEMEIDCLTGSHCLLRTDIVMDVGESLNPAVDVGQIEGAFLQGYGLLCLEEVQYTRDGYNTTRGPDKYHIPGLADIPARMHVSLLRGSSNPRAVYSSRAVGEPPLLSATSALGAIREAVAAARAQEGLPGPFRLDSPATPDRVRQACHDSILQLVKCGVNTTTTASPTV